MATSQRVLKNDRVLAEQNIDKGRVPKLHFLISTTGYAVLDAIFQNIQCQTIDSICCIKMYMLTPFSLLYECMYVCMYGERRKRKCHF